MRGTLMSLLLATALVTHERRITVGSESLFVRVHSADAAKPAAMHITMSGSLFYSLGIDKPFPGTLHLEGSTGTATGVVKGELSESPGEIAFTSDEAGVDLEIGVGTRSGVATPGLRARGRVVSVVRGADGALSVNSSR